MAPDSCVRVHYSDSMKTKKTTAHLISGMRDQIKALTEQLDALACEICFPVLATAIDIAQEFRVPNNHPDGWFDKLDLKIELFDKLYMLPLQLPYKPSYPCEELVEDVLDNALEDGWLKQDGDRYRSWKYESASWMANHQAMDPLADLDELTTEAGKIFNREEDENSVRLTLNLNK